MAVTRIVHTFNNLVRDVRKKHVGKGPDQITTRFVGSWAVCEMKGNMTSVEKFAIRSEEGKRIVRQLRTTFIKEIYKDSQIRSGIENAVDAELITLFCDFDVELDIAVTVYVFDHPLGLDDET